MRWPENYLAETINGTSDRRKRTRKQSPRMARPARFVFWGIFHPSRELISTLCLVYNIHVALQTQDNQSRKERERLERKVNYCDKMEF